MDKQLNNPRNYINTILEILLIYSFLESYIGEYIWSGFYFISSRIYVLVLIWLFVELLLASNKSNKAFNYLIYWLIFSLVSFLFNFSGLAGLLIYLKTYLLPFIIIYWIIENHSGRLVKIFFYMVILNVLLNLGWLLKINPLPNRYINTLDDLAIGTVGTAFFAFLSIAFILYGYIYKKKFVAVISGFCLILSNSLALWGIFLPTMISATKFRIKHYLSITIVIGILIISFSYLMPNVYSFTVNRLDLVSKLKFAKLEMYSEMITEFQSHPLNLIYGFGPGERSSYASEEVQSKFYNNEITYYSENLYIEGSSIIDKYYSGIASVVWETGLAGLFLFIMILYKYLFNKGLTPREKKLNFAFLVLFILWSMVMDTFRNTNLSILYMMMIGILGLGIEQFIPERKEETVNLNELVSYTN